MLSGRKYDVSGPDVVMPQWQLVLYLDDVRLPVEALIGEGDSALAQLFAGLNPQRTKAAASSVGIGRCALDKAVASAEDAEGHRPRRRR